LLLHVGVGYSGEDFADHAPTRDYDPFTQLGLTRGTLIRQFPVITIGSAGVNFGGLSGGSGGMGPLVQSTTGSERRPAWNSNATLVSGNHTFKLGIEARYERYPRREHQQHGGQPHVRRRANGPDCAHQRF
jgi:hypothetical protein